MRTNAWLRSVVWMGAVLSGLGCAPSSVPLEEFPTTFGDAYCARVFGCCDTAERAMLAVLVGTTEAECRMRAPALYGTLRTRVEAGSLTYDASLAGTCLERVQGASCAAGLGDSFAPECDAVFTGRAAAGAACTDSQDCIPGHHCGGPVDARTCRASVAVGGACALSDFGACVSGAFCDTSTMTCAALRADGAACTSSEQCSSSRCDGVCAAAVTACDGN